MLNFSAEEWHGFLSIPLVSKFMKQLRVEVGSVTDQVGRGAVLSSSPSETAIRYARTVGRIDGLIEILEYEPERTDDEQDT